MSITKTGKKRAPFSLETRKKMSIAKIGQIVSEETRRKRSENIREYLDNGGIPYNTKFLDPEEAKRNRSWVKNKRNRAIRILIENNQSHTFGEWETLKKQYNNTCPACKKSEPEIILTQDHIIPVSKGGSDLIENIQPLCGDCNCRKHTKIIKFEI